MKGFIILLMCGAIVALCSANVCATDHCGDVSGVWSANDNPHNITCEIRVPQGATLTIEPGCYVNFLGHYKLVVDTSATLIAVGNPTDSIIFTAADTITGWHGIRFYSADSSSGLSYCRIEYGRPVSSYEDLDGGGIYCSNSSPTISNNNISNNSTGYYGYGCGGGISCYSSSPTISGNTISHNSAGTYSEGGGIYCYQSSPAITNNTISDNYAASGGGILCDSSSPLISNNLISDNHTTFSISGGGGIGCWNSAPIIIDNVITRNEAWGWESSGGGIYSSQSNSVIFRNTISHNTATWGGGISIGYGSIILNSISLVIGNIIHHNSAGVGAGILCAENTDNFLANNVISDNDGSSGDGVYCWDSSPTVTNCVIWPNRIRFQGESFPVFAYCDIQGGWPGEGNIDVDPLFRDAENGDFHLMASACGYPYDSPCIDAGDPTLLDSLLGCAWGLGELRSDMGAYGGDAYPVGIEEPNEPTRPIAYSMPQNYPNPFNSSTEIRYFLPARSVGGKPTDLPTYDVRLEIYNLLGQRIEILFEGRRQHGEHSVTWDARNYSSGIYFYKLVAGNKVFTKRMTLLK